MTGWLDTATVPLFLSDVRLRIRRGLPRARQRWALDSGGYSQLSTVGEWTGKPAEYVDRVRRYRQEIGQLDWAAVRDWMCEPKVLRKTGLTVREHQDRTIDSLIELQSLAPDVPWAPVLQGQGEGSHLCHVDHYERRGVHLRQYPVVGVGSVCRLQSTREGVSIFESLAPLGLALHGFGVKTVGLRKIGQLLVSADSLAWSSTARHERIRLPGHSHKNCANCMDFALQWRERVVDGVSFAPRPAGFEQLRLF